MYQKCLSAILVSAAFAATNADAKSTDYHASVDVVRDGQKSHDYVKGYVFWDQNRDGLFNPHHEPGIPNVLVSNGREVVKTDQEGRYHLPVFYGMTVFITKPSDFEVPLNEDNIPQFYYHHLPSGSPELRFGGLAPTGPLPSKINFPLIPGEYKKKFKVIVSGDTQPYSNNEVGYVRDTLANEIAASKDKDIEAILIEGDILGDDLSLYPRFKKILSVADTPQYYVPGNHDLDYDAPSDMHSYDTFKREFGPAYYSFDIGAVHFVVLDNVKYPCTPKVDNLDGLHEFCSDPVNSPAYNGVITKRQMKWLENDLAYVAPDKLIVFNMHIPLVSYVDKNSTQHQTDNAEALYALVKGRKALALSGHTHTLEHFQTGEYFQGWEESLGIGPTPFPQIIAGAACGSWWSGDFTDQLIPESYQRLGAPRGYLVFEFDHNTYKEYWKATGKHESEQMSLAMLSPSFMKWYEKLQAWMNEDPKTRSAVPPVNINDLPDTKILTDEDLSDQVYLSINVWDGSRDSKVWVKIDDAAEQAAHRTQSGDGDDTNLVPDPFALQRQMYVFRYAAISESGDPRAQGFELFRGNHLGPDNPQPLEEFFLTNRSNHHWLFELPSDLGVGIHKAHVMTEDAYGNRYEKTLTFEVMPIRPFPYAQTELFE